jgi:hypothetical protein
MVEYTVSDGNNTACHVLRVSAQYSILLIVVQHMRVYTISFASQRVSSILSDGTDGSCTL